MRRRIAIALWIVAAPAALACTPQMKLAQVVEHASKAYETNPRSTIHQCFLPFMARIEEEESLAVRETFLHLVVTKTTMRPPHPHNLNLIIEAGDAYLAVVSNVESPQPARVAGVLTRWGKALLFANRKQALLTVHRNYARMTSENPALLNVELARMWLAVLRCSSDNPGCRTQPEFECGFRLECGADDVVVAYLRENPGSKRSWDDFLQRLNTSVANGQAALRSTRDDVQSVLDQVSP
ncbi:MAG TPA: hypothetical protein VNI54_02345 [Thermoanaerobaculia bacterium]|nr:hypothetical protein [Thermoanaerobaculia bacterium]